MDDLFADIAAPRESEGALLARAPVPAATTRGRPSLAPELSAAHRVEALLLALKAKYGDRIVAHLSLPAEAGRYEPLPEQLTPALRKALLARGIDRLYSHQRAAWDSIAAGRHTVIATPTASGKSLCYNLPVLHAAILDRSKALYLFPTKALAQDQVAELLELNDRGTLGVRAYTFDGDTPGDARKAVRLHGDVVVTNPDMLHQGILPHHTKWAQFFENLRIVVIDELHTYRGVFGSHVANLLRRLRRVCRFYGSTPVFVASSATIANPRDLAEQLIDAPVHEVSRTGAPRGERHLLLWNPPLINPDLGIRASARSQTIRIAQAAVSVGLKTIVFANSRLEVEVITKYLKDRFDRDPRGANRVAAYRGGYLPTERRDKEVRLRAGALDCVVTTSALELGVDIGSLDMAILNGYPGSVASAWQRFGRAGRRGTPSVSVLVATSDLLDQYLMRHPDTFLQASPEYARIDPDQLLINMDHVRCAAFELPFRSGEDFGRDSLEAKLTHLSAERVLQREEDDWYWIAEGYPANTVSLRSIAEGNFVVVDLSGKRDEVLAEVDYASAALTLYEGAIYMVQAIPWQVERLDWNGRKAFVRRTRADYYTDAIVYTKLKVLDEFESVPSGRARVSHGEVHVLRRVPGYKKIRYYTHENVGYGDVRLPDLEMHTTAVWWHVSPEALMESLGTREAALDGFLGAAYTLHRMAALVSLAELRDIGRAVGDGNGAWSAVISSTGRETGPQVIRGTAEVDLRRAASFQPTLFLYDNHPGGIGLSVPLFDQRENLATRSLHTVRRCPCSAGCPSCIGPVLVRSPTAPGSTDSPSAKANAIRVLELLDPAR